MTALKPILLIEDDPIDAAIVKRALQDLQVHNPVTHVRDAEEGLDYLLDTRNEFPCLVLVDATLPRMEASELLRLMKRDPALKALPTVVLINPALTSDPGASYELGADGYVMKTMDYDQYVKALEMARSASSLVAVGEA
jgi:CheY-like chemotaxis protein